MTRCRLGSQCKRQCKSCPSWRELDTPGKAAGTSEGITANQGAEACVYSCFQDQARKREVGVGWVAAGGACEIS